MDWREVAATLNRYALVNRKHALKMRDLITPDDDSMQRAMLLDQICSTFATAIMAGLDEQSKK